MAWPALGTTAAIFLTEPAMLDHARSILAEEIAAIDQACSRFRSDSELSRLNQAGGHAIAASDLFLGWTVGPARVAVLLPEVLPGHAGCGLR